MAAPVRPTGARSAEPAAGPCGPRRLRRQSPASASSDTVPHAASASSTAPGATRPPAGVPPVSADLTMAAPIRKGHALKRALEDLRRESQKVSRRVTGDWMCECMCQWIHPVSRTPFRKRCLCLLCGARDTRDQTGCRVTVSDGEGYCPDCRTRHWRSSRGSGTAASSSTSAVPLPVPVSIVGSTAKASSARPSNIPIEQWSPLSEMTSEVASEI